MEQDIRVSVIVPVYNVEHYLPRCVDSLLAQTYRNLEIFLVDDGAKDASGAICDAYASRDSRIRVIHKENGGLSSARNAALDVATGEYISFVDSDDWIEPDFYETMLAAVKKYGVKLTCAGRYDVDEGVDVKTPGLCPEREEVISGEELVRRIFRWQNIDSAAWDKLYHRDLFREIRYPVGRICEDVPVTYRIALNAGRAAMIPKPLYCYFHRPNSITKSSVSPKTFHFTEHSEQVYQDIHAHYPALEKEGRYLYLRGLAYIVQNVDLSDEVSRRTYAKETCLWRKKLRQQLPFLWQLDFATAKERRDFTLAAFGLYRGMLNVYLRIKRRGKANAL